MCLNHHSSHGSIGRHHKTLEPPQGPGFSAIHPQLGANLLPTIMLLQPHLQYRGTHPMFLAGKLQSEVEQDIHQMSSHILTVYEGT